MLKTYQGSCHCGAVRFEADADLAAGTLRCNCSFCLKARLWVMVVKPVSFRLLAGGEALARYQFCAMRGEHFFCRHCGIHPFGTGDSPRWGKFYGVSVTCLDNASDEEFAAAPVAHIDGRNDRWDAAPAAVGFL